jgi:hypothetical protein
MINWTGFINFLCWIDARLVAEIPDRAASITIDVGFSNTGHDIDAISSFLHIDQGFGHV